MTNKKNIVVFSLRLANRLAYYGHSVKEVGINKNNPKYNVYYFEDCEEVRQIIEDFKQNPYK